MRFRYALARAASLLVAVGVGMVTVTCVARAVTTVTTPQAALFVYGLAAGGDSVAQTPATDQATWMMGSCNENRGVCQVALLHRSGGGISWTGLQPLGAQTHASAITSPGTVIANLDEPSQVQVELVDGNSIKIHNGSSSTRDGALTLIW